MTLMTSSLWISNKYVKSIANPAYIDDIIIGEYLNNY